MSTLDAIFLIAGIVGVIFVIWSYTKRGKKWLSDL